MKVALAYPYTDGDGEDHEPDSVLDLPDREGRRLIRDGTARAVADDASDGLFDPSRVTVNRVLAHLADADADERTRVLDAERAGKAREGVLTFNESGE